MADKRTKQTYKKSAINSFERHDFVVIFCPFSKTPP